ncbi:MAG: HIT family protein, partial [Rubrivivax sp.]
MAGRACPLCDGPGGTLLAASPQLRVIRAAETGFPAFYRVVWTQHVAEFSALTSAERQACMEAVACVERALLDHLPAALAPTKINLAALGNMVPHLHWHVIARHDWDSHFPAPVWAAPVRPAPADRLA